MYPNNSKSTSNKQTQQRRASHTNFIEALKSTGSSIVKDTAKSFKDDLVVGGGKQMVDSIFNTNQNTQAKDQQPDFNFNEYLRSNERRTKAHQQVKYEYEQQETVIFNRRQEEVDKKISEIKVELKKIQAGLDVIDTSTQTVINQEIVNPGTYHLNFFEKLLKFLQHMRKRVVESRHWHSINSQRSTTKSYYWKQANNKIGGTKFMLSQERQVATQTG